VTRATTPSIRLFSSAGVTDGPLKRLNRYDYYFGRAEGDAATDEGRPDPEVEARLLEMYRRWVGTRKILRKLSEDCETFCSTGW